MNTTNIYIIEKGIDIPCRERPCGPSEGPITSAIKRMQIGDSILFRTFKEKDQAYASCVKRFGKGSCASRKEGSGFRFWRTDPAQKIKSELEQLADIL